MPSCQRTALKRGRLGGSRNPQYFSQKCADENSKSQLVSAILRIFTELISTGFSYIESGCTPAGKT